LRPRARCDFGSTPEGAECAKLWGRNAGRKLAIVHTRLERMLGAGDMAAASAWLGGLPPQDAVQIMKAHEAAYPRAS
jgi:hypothetical protein